jgi:hypothetical protein
VITYPGYDRGRGLPIEHTLFPATGFAYLVMDVRGPADPTVVIRGITDPDSYYYTRVFVDAARAVDIVAELPGADADRIALSGGSQGGALALASAALCADLVAVCHAEVPMLCDIARAVRISPMVPYTVATARMDRSGRICERILLRALAWEPGQRLEIDTLHGMIIIAATPDGPHTVDPRGGLGLPASLRRLCGIEPGPSLTLAAAIPAQVLIVHPAATVATLLAAHYTDLIRTHHDNPS